MRRGVPLKHHVLEEMAHAGDFVGLVARAGAHEEADAQRMGLVVALGDNLQAVVERGTGETSLLLLVFFWNSRLNHEDTKARRTKEEVTLMNAMIASRFCRH